MLGPSHQAKILVSVRRQKAPNVRMWSCLSVIWIGSTGFRELFRLVLHFAMSSDEGSAYFTFLQAWRDFARFVAWGIDRIMTFSPHTSCGQNLHVFNESGDDFSSEDEYISPSVGHKMSSDESTLEESNYEDPRDLQCKSWPPPRGVLRALPDSAQVLLRASAIHKFYWNKSFGMHLFTQELFLRPQIG